MIFWSFICFPPHKWFCTIRAESISWKSMLPPLGKQSEHPCKCLEEITLCSHPSLDWFSFLRHLWGANRVALSPEMPFLALKHSKQEKTFILVREKRWKVNLSKVRSRTWGKQLSLDLLYYNKSSFFMGEEKICLARFSNLQNKWWRLTQSAYWGKTSEISS